GHVDQEHAVGEECQAPDVRAVVGEAEVVRLVPLRAQVEFVNDLAAPPRLEVHVYDEEEVIVLGVGVHTVDVEVFLGPVEALDEGRQAGFRTGRGRGLEPGQAEQAGGQPASTG